MLQRQISSPELPSSQSSVSPTSRASLSAPNTSPSCMPKADPPYRYQELHERNNDSRSKSYGSPGAKAALEHWLLELPHHHPPSKSSAQDHSSARVQSKSLHAPRCVSHTAPSQKTGNTTPDTQELHTEALSDLSRLDRSMAARMLIALNQQRDSRDSTPEQKAVAVTVPEDTRQHDHHHYHPQYPHYSREHSPETRIHLDPQVYRVHEARPTPRITDVKVEEFHDEKRAMSRGRQQSPLVLHNEKSRSQAPAPPISSLDDDVQLAPRKRARQLSNSRPTSSAKETVSSQSPIGRTRSPCINELNTTPSISCISMDGGATGSEPLEEPEGGDELSIKRYKNTLAARRSRAKKVMILEAERARAKDLEHANWELQKRVVILETEQEQLKGTNESQRLHISHLEAELARALEKIKDRG
ncbi:hypothetical protein BGX28_000260 [Mortierella sp. GBA30]|nr:hypothetical protein BGX28_000260 [Mortierella sp. GBA30]